MQLTLKNARRLEANIAQAAETLSSQVKDKLKLVLSAYDAEALGARVRKQQQSVTLALDDLTQLITLRYWLRNLIEQSNMGQGVSRLLNENAMLIAKLRLLALETDKQAHGIYRRRGQHGDPVTDALLETLLKKFQAVRENAGAAVAKEDEFELSFVLTQQQLDEQRAMLAGIKADLERNKDKIAAANVSAKLDLTLSSQQVALLTRYNVVYGAEG
jgi:hypothetical protein